MAEQHFHGPVGQVAGGDILATFPDLEALPVAELRALKSQYQRTLRRLSRELLGLGALAFAAFAVIVGLGGWGHGFWGLAPFILLGVVAAVLGTVAQPKLDAEAYCRRKIREINAILEVRRDAER